MFWSLSNKIRMVLTLMYEEPQHWDVTHECFNEAVFTYPQKRILVYMAEHVDKGAWSRNFISIEGVAYSLSRREQVRLTKAMLLLAARKAIEYKKEEYITCLLRNVNELGKENERLKKTLDSLNIMNSQKTVSTTCRSRLRIPRKNTKTM